MVVAPVLFLGKWQEKMLLLSHQSGPIRLFLLLVIQLLLAPLTLLL